jgi:hypothetical protein
MAGIMILKRSGVFTAIRGRLLFTDADLKVQHRNWPTLSIARHFQKLNLLIGIFPQRQKHRTGKMKEAAFFAGSLFLISIKGSGQVLDFCSFPSTVWAESKPCLTIVCFELKSTRKSERLT